MDGAPGEVVIPLRSRLDEIGRLARLVEAFGQAHAIPADVLLCVNLALDEVITNIVLYAYPDAQEHEILARLRLEGPELVVEVEDDGRAFDPLAVPDVDPEARAEAGAVGGLGVHIVRMVMDGLEYRRERGRNVLAMRKAAREAQG
jgi:anti-sigma regulatory factor (Ser/Thr protein kinase)